MVDLPRARLDGKCQRMPGKRMIERREAVAESVLSGQPVVSRVHRRSPGFVVPVERRDARPRGAGCQGRREALPAGLPCGPRRPRDAFALTGTTDQERGKARPTELAGSGRGGRQRPRLCCYVMDRSAIPAVAPRRGEARVPVCAVTIRAWRTANGSAPGHDRTRR